MGRSIAEDADLFAACCLRLQTLLDASLRPLLDQLTLTTPTKLRGGAFLLADSRSYSTHGDVSTFLEAQTWH